MYNTVHLGEKGKAVLVNIRVSNCQDSCYVFFKFLLAAHPAFVEKFVDQFVKIGQRAAIRCIAAGNPTPNVSWTLDGQPLPNVPGIKEGSFNNGLGDVISYVNISNVDIAFGGQYTCKVSNDVGMISHTGSMNVYGELHVCEFYIYPSVPDIEKILMKL